MSDLTKERDPRADSSGRPRPSTSDFPSLKEGSGKFQKCIGRENPSSPQANSGTRIHQKCFDWDSIELEGRELELATQCVDEREIILDRIFPNRKENPEDKYDEERMWYRKERYSGVPDVLRIRDGVACIIDYKTGPISVVPAPLNWQLAGLAALAFHNHKITACHTIIVQPLAGRPSTAYYDKNELIKARNQINALMRKVEQESPPLKAGTSQCRYCLAKADCPALQEKEDALMTRFEGVSILTPEKLSFGLDMIPLVEARCKAIKEEAARRLEKDPNAVPGYALRVQGERRVIRDTMAAAEVLVAKGLIDRASLIEIASLPLGRLEAAVSRFAGLDKYEARFEVSEALSGVIEHTQPKPKVVEA